MGSVRVHVRWALLTCLWCSRKQGSRQTRGLALIWSRAVLVSLFFTQPKAEGMVARSIQTGTSAKLPQADEIKPLATYSKGGLRVTNHSTRYICQRKHPPRPERRLPLVLPLIHPLPLIDPSFPLVETRFRDSIRSIALYLLVLPTLLPLACDACRAWYSKIGPVLRGKAGVLVPYSAKLRCS